MDLLIDWLRGELSRSGRIWAAIAPALLLVGALLVALVVYVWRNARRGQFHDEEMDGRGLGGLTTARVRHFFAWVMRPLWQGLARAEIPPDAITMFSACLAVGSGVAFAAGRFSLGGWLYLTAGALDFLDGRVARATGRATKGGAVLDSVLDRYAEAAILVGLAWFYRDRWVLFACLLALTGSMFVPYIRARGEAAGVKMADVGVMQRAERILAIGLTTSFSPVLEALLVPNDPHPPHRIAIAGIALVAASSHATAIQRLAHVLKILDPSADRGPALQPFSRTVLVSALATAVDFILVWTLVEQHVTAPAIATVAGCVVGGVVAFSGSRVWAFEATDGPRIAQAGRYIFVSASSALLNASGVALIMLLPAIDYRVAWVGARALVFVTWNYPLLRGFVFAPKAVGHPIEESGEA